MYSGSRARQMVPDGEPGTALVTTDVLHGLLVWLSILADMLTDTPLIPKIMDNELIGFLTAVDPGGQPQTSPVWFVRDGDDIVVYNRADTRRLTSLGSNPKVAFNLRGDLRGRGAILIEGTASVENDLPAALDFAGYLDKYGREIERLGWTAHSFSNDYPTGVRITVTRVRSWGLETLDT